MVRLPDVVTHIYHPEDGPFRNLCACDPDEQARIVARMRAGGRPLKDTYLTRRRATEAWLKAERTRRFGAPATAHPVYFFLGDVRDGLDPWRPAAIVLPIGALAPETLTFTYPDSMASLEVATRPESIAYRRPYHGQVFSKAEIADVVAAFGLPGQRWRHEEAMRYDRFIEMQVWDVDRLAQVMSAGVEEWPTSSAPNSTSL